MPFIRVTDHKTKSVHDVNINKIIKYEVQPGNKFTTIDLDDNWCLLVDDEPRQLRGYIKKAEGTLPEKAEPNVEVVISGIAPIGNFPTSLNRV